MDPEAALITKETNREAKSHTKRKAVRIEKMDSKRAEKKMRFKIEVLLLKVS